MRRWAHITEYLSVFEHQEGFCVQNAVGGMTGDLGCESLHNHGPVLQDAEDFADTFQGLLWIHLRDLRNHDIFVEDFVRSRESTSRTTAFVIFIVDAVQELPQFGRIEFFNDRRIVGIRVGT